MGKIPMAIIGGAVGSLIGAVIWGVISVVTGYQIGWIAVGVGFLVGILVRISAKGTEPTFGVIGAAFAIFGCVLGNYLAVVGFVAKEADVSFFSVLSSFDFSTIIQVMKATFSPMDLVFYAIAGYEGFKFAVVED